MSQELVISSNPIETAVAVLEDDRLVEVHVEHHTRKALTGSIYKGRVTRVLPGMQSAFVNLGLQRDAFLYVTDVLDPSEGIGEDLDAGPIKAEPIPPLRTAKKDSGKSPGPAKSGAADGGSGQAAGSTRSSRRRRRRRRSRHRAGRAKAAPPVKEEAKEDVKEEQSSGSPAQGARDDGAPVLPGESIAKYRSAPREEAPKREAGKARRAVSPGADAPPRREPGQAAEAAGPPPEEPPKRSASVAGPSTLSELRLGVLKWIKRKVETHEPTPPKPAPPKRPAREPQAEKRTSQPRKRQRSRRRRPKAQPRQARGDGPRPGPSPQPGKRRSGRRRRPARRSQGGRAKAGAKGGGSRRGGIPPRERQPSPQANIKDLLKPGQEVLVQVNKEPVGAKGARITSHVSLPGRYMIYMTTAKHNGVARKIQPHTERKRLRTIVDKHSADKAGGFVVRTAARGVSEDVLVSDMDFLYKLWSGLQEKALRRKAPAKLHSDLDIVERMLRDNLGQDCKRVWVDSDDEFERIMRFFERFAPDMAGRVKLYSRPQPIHDAFGITKDLERALRPKVWLKSGGYVVINQTEALVAIDVNTGRYVGKSNRLEDTVLKTNLEAAEEIARQLRLRDLGGIIVIDFIDMEDRKNRQAVHQVLQEALRKMRSPSRVLPFNDFGLVVITRKAVRKSLERALCIPCPTCSGSGTVKSSATVLSEIFSAGDRLAANSKKRNGRKSSDVTLRVHPEIAKSLKRKSSSHLEDLEAVVGRGVIVHGDSSMHLGQFTLR